MIHELFLLLLILHVASDFHLQSEKMAENKARSMSGVLWHAKVLALVALVGAILLSAFGTPWLLSVLLLAVIFLLHLLLDLLKYFLCTIFPGLRADTWIFVVDQMLHLFVLWLVTFVLLPLTNLHHDIYFLVPLELLKWILLALVATKPANVAFKKLFTRYAVLEEATTDMIDTFPEPGAGALIGNLERLLSIAFLGVGQYAAIGLVFTAKSIARFRQIEQNKRFAEYYLIGTLFSMLYAIVAYFVVFAHSFPI